MLLIVIYLLLVTVGYLAVLGIFVVEQSVWLEPYRVGFICAAIGGMGGCVYCLRGVYLSVSVRRNWSREWYIWYFLRPIVSAICGAVSYVFLRAGLLILESGTRPDASEMGFYALAFIAGLNVDKFVSKIEDIAQAVWGIEKSRASKTGNEGEQK